MKVTWISPQGAGLEIAKRVRDAGHQVVVYGLEGELPRVEKQDLFTFASAADLVVVDGTFPVERTRRNGGRVGRSWRPDRDALFVDELRRKHDVQALGPTPTVDLLVGDRRYLRKWCERLSIPYAPDAEGAAWSSGAWFKDNEIVPPGVYLESWKPLFKSIGFRGWFELEGVMTKDGPAVQRCNAHWPTYQIPLGREAEFLLSMVR